MSTMKKSYSSHLKAKVVLEALKEEKTLGELSSLYEINSDRIVQWRKQAKEELYQIFENKKTFAMKEQEALIERLYHQIGKLQVEYDWLKKKIGTAGL